ncbi:hypothetical protein CQW23_25687 [Capsicum baccatum]|uniref:NB-ARC domain-containing protein n=1 Tax=Capsicum baccatum TaxID=33114 RepID=A0A2G2VLQ2_CAPBA|nr:hypothetical protein CQW23_25687 [Capsicum baccatum]
MVGEVAYELAIPPEFTPDDQLTFVEEPVLVLASDVRQLHTREILVVKIQWRHRPVEENTWEIESEMWSQYPHLFETSVNPEKYVDDMMMPGKFGRAYSSVISLLQTLEQRNPQLFHCQTTEMLDFLRATAEYFRKVLEQASKIRPSNTEKIKSLEEIIRIAANNAKDVVDLKIFHIIKDTSAMKKSMQREDLLQVVEKMDATKIEVMTIVSELSSSINDIVEDEIVEVSMLPNLEDVVVRGLDDDLELIVERLRGRQSDLDIVTISGMGGIGKTTLARKTHDHLSIRYHFDLRVWVTISQEFRSRNVLLDALHCISKQPNSFIGEDYDKKDDNELADLVQ